MCCILGHTRKQQVNAISTCKGTSLHFVLLGVYLTTQTACSAYIIDNTVMWWCIMASDSRKPSQYFFVHHTSCMICIWVEPGPPRWEPGDWSPELWHGLCFDVSESESEIGWIILAISRWRNCPRSVKACFAALKPLRDVTCIVPSSSECSYEICGGGGGWRFVFFGLFMG
jgi:hypothetical protein